MEDHQRIAIISLNQKVVLRSQSGLPIAVNDLYHADDIFCTEHDDRFDDTDDDDAKSISSSIIIILI